MVLRVISDGWDTMANLFFFSKNKTNSHSRTKATLKVVSEKGNDKIKILIEGNLQRSLWGKVDSHLVWGEIDKMAAHVTFIVKAACIIYCT